MSSSKQLGEVEATECGKSDRSSRQYWHKRERKQESNKDALTGLFNDVEWCTIFKIEKIDSSQQGRRRVAISQRGQSRGDLPHKRSRWPLRPRPAFAPRLVGGGWMVCVCVCARAISI